MPTNFLNHLEIHSTCGDVIWWKQGSAGCVSPPTNRSKRRRWVVKHHQSFSPLKWAEPPVGREIGTRRQPSSISNSFFWKKCLRESPPNKNWSNNKSLKGLSISSPHWIFEKKKDDIPTEIPGPTTSENPPLGLSVCSEKPTSPEATPPQKQGLNHRVTILLIYDQALSTPFFWRDISRPFHGATFEKLPCHTDSWAFTSCEERFLLEPCDFPLLERDFCLTLALYQERKIAGSKNGLQTNQQV